MSYSEWPALPRQSATTQRSDHHKKPSLGWSSCFCAVGLALAMISGCGEQRVEVYPVKGNLYFQGEPPIGAQIVLHPTTPAESPLAAEVTPTGTVAEDGSFSITTYDPGDGAPVGDYIVTVQWFKLVNDDGGTGRGPNVLPSKYASPRTSPLRLTVPEGGTEISPIEITPE